MEQNQIAGCLLIGARVYDNYHFYHRLPVGADSAATEICGSSGKSAKVVRMIVGAQPYAQFKEAIEWALSQMKK